MPQTKDAEILDVPPEERISKTRTIYDVRISEIFWRNFIAGMGRGLGGLVFYLVVFFIISLGFIQFVLPQLKPFLDTYQRIGDSVGNIQRFNFPGRDDILRY
jgi:hypothetical protein